MSHENHGFCSSWQQASSFEIKNAEWSEIKTGIAKFPKASHILSTWSACYVTIPHLISSFTFRHLVQVNGQVWDSW